MPFSQVKTTVDPDTVQFSIGRPVALWNHLGRLALVCCAQIGVIGVGTMAGSAAMQWCGFALLALVLLTISKRSKTYTPQEAADMLLADYGVRARS